MERVGTPALPPLQEGGSLQQPTQPSIVCALVEKGPMVPVRAGHWSRLPNRDQLLGTNAGLGSSTNRDR
jgi:hypothetical protein